VRRCHDVPNEYRFEIINSDGHLRPIARRALRKTPERKIRSAKLLSLVEKLAWSEMRDIVQDADVVVDQFTTGAYGTLSCEAMAAGRPVVANLGNDVFYQEGNNERSMFLARLPMLILTMLFGLVVFAFARDLVGPAGGLVALTLYAFSPDVIAHGSLAGVGMPVAGFLLTMLWLLWRGRRRPYVYLPLVVWPWVPRWRRR
jgi:hypothetical protein